MFLLNVILGIFIVAGIVFMVRNNQTFNFRTALIDRVFIGNNWAKKQKIFDNGPSYSKMMYSLKPLKLESFYTPEEIKILNDD